MNDKSAIHLIFNTKSILLFVMLLLASSGAYLVNSFSTSNPDKIQITKKIQHRINKLEKNTDQILVKIKNTLSRTEDFSMIDSLVKNQIGQSDQFSFLVFAEDSLIYWSDNHVPIPDIVSDTNLISPAKYLDNGWYDIREDTLGSFMILGLIKIKNNYPYQNDHLQNDFSGTFDLSSEINVSNVEAENNVFDQDGNFLLALSIPDVIEQQNLANLLSPALFIFAYIFLLAFIFTIYKNLLPKSAGNVWMLIAFIADLLLLRWLLFHFEFPLALYNTQLFSPEYFAVSEYLPSLGDLLLNLITLLAVAFAIHQWFSLSLRNAQLRTARFILTGILVLLYNYFLMPV